MPTTPAFHRAADSPFSPLSIFCLNPPHFLAHILLKAHTRPSYTSENRTPATPIPQPRSHPYQSPKYTKSLKQAQLEPIQKLSQWKKGERRKQRTKTCTPPTPASQVRPSPLSQSGSPSSKSPITRPRSRRGEPGTFPRSFVYTFVSKRRK